MIFVFDLDDTLYEERLFFYNGLKSAAVTISKKFNLNKKKVYSNLIKEFKKNGRDKIFDRFLKKNKIFSKKSLSLAVRAYRSNNLKIKFYNDAKRILTEFNVKKKYIVTDGNRVVQKNKINNLGIKKYFKKIYITRNYAIKHEKPSLYCFKKILINENIKWNSLIYVGDNPSKDFVNLNKKGSITIRILRGNYKRLKPIKKIYEAKYKFKSFDRSFFKLLKNYDKKN